MKVALIIPCFNEEQNIVPFYQECLQNFKDSSYTFQYIFINDGSKDNTLEAIKNLILKEKNENIYCLNFSRNFGKESAIYAGLNKCIELNVDYASIIDADLQQDPKYVMEMLNIIINNSQYDVIACYQEKRKENKIISFLKNLFYKTINKMSETPFYSNASDFRLFNKKVINSLVSLNESNRFSKGIFSWLGFNTCYIPYNVKERLHGKSSWSLKSLFKYAFDGIINFSYVPLKFSPFFGTILFIASLIYLLIAIIQKFTIGLNLIGYPLIIFLILFIGGIELISFGILGEYIKQIHNEVKNRPIYILKDEFKYENKSSKDSFKATKKRND